MSSMNRKETPMTRRGLGAIDTYTRLAPSVEKGWVEQFVLEQRLIGVPGSRIGDSLALIESHVAESGESAQTAFGDATAYAKEDASVQGERPSAEVGLGWGFGIALGLAGMLLVTFSAQAGFAGRSTLEVTVGHLVVLAIVAVSFALLLFATHALMRALTRLPIRSWIGWMVMLAAMVGALFLLPQPVGEMSIWGAVIVGVVLLIAGYLIQLRAHLSGDVQDDPILGPGEQPGRSRASLVATLIFPVATFAMVGFSWLLQQIPEMF